jgi:hypothetical protein
MRFKVKHGTKTILGSCPFFDKDNSLASLGAVISIIPAGCIWVSNQAQIPFSVANTSAHMVQIFLILLACSLDSQLQTHTLKIGNKPCTVFVTATS